jgi:hypothetical protein
VRANPCKQPKERSGLTEAKYHSAACHSFGGCSSVRTGSTDACCFAAMASRAASACASSCGLHPDAPELSRDAARPHRFRQPAPDEIRAVREKARQRDRERERPFNSPDGRFVLFRSALRGVVQAPEGVQ